MKELASLHDFLLILDVGVNMQVLIHQQMNIISAVVLLFFIIYSSNVFDKKLKLNKLYLVSLSLNILLITLNIMLDFLIAGGSTTSAAIRSVKALILAAAPCLAFVFLKTVCNYYPRPFKIKNSVRLVFNLLMLVNTVTAVSMNNISIISEYTVSIFVSFIFTAYSAFVVFKSRNKIIRFEFASIFTVTVMASMFLIIQITAGATASIWCVSSIILVFMFVIIQQRELYRDSLTGARNRIVLKKSIDAYAKKPYGTPAVIMIDLDHFKSINDCYGHSEGDYALKAFVRILQKAYSEQGIVIRMGGDEFLVLINDACALEVNDMIRGMAKMIDNFNSKNEKPYKIKYSYASGMYDNKGMSLEQFIHDLDMKMYQNKQGRRDGIWSIKNISSEGLRRN
ncbi:diguanylate cyclase (GGDEF)-like protein [Ruminiclostridium sufflavum DSM 19573]|uniref:Diguanylate cyclase (GGDEF)-like protein n=1 Tax=Ruminiclostridium sufflavum DSM 19573 TaxID=1121337 RepID=A0A318Y413_9FIRM|nr:GGDEF domain-containing protein [Ruminiclostridium sufflavum]PYG90328.1 diguanylate cyclase (GGDEF)-like protein [Ruminiclostridium sufflavum DSM 19573]